MEKNEAGLPLYEQAYEIIKSDITFNRLKPGDALIEVKLCERLNISRTPLRAALQKLVSDGLATTDSNKSVVVSNVTEEDILALTPVRLELEALLVRALAGQLGTEEIESLESLHRREMALVAERNYLGLVDIGYQFHMTLAHMTGNHFLYDTVERIETVASRYLILSGTMDRYGAVGAEEHGEIIAYLARGQFGHAELSMREHIERIGRRILVSE